MVQIAYLTELNLQICDYAQNDAFVAKIVNTGLTNIFMVIFAPDERLPSSATLPSRDYDLPTISKVSILRKKFAGAY